MIHELREYRFSADNWVKYLHLFRTVCMPIRGNAYGHLMGAWTSGVGVGQVGFTHLWAYQSLAERTTLRAALFEQSGWVPDFIEPAKLLINHQTLSILNPATDRAMNARSLAERGVLHRARCAVGRAAMVSSEIERLTGGACWTTEFSDPNEVAWFSQDSHTDVELHSSSFTEGLVHSIRSIALSPLTHSVLETSH